MSHESTKSEGVDVTIYRRTKRYRRRFFAINLRVDARSIGHRHRRCRELLISVVLLLVNVRSTEPKMVDSGCGMYVYDVMCIWNVILYVDAVACEIWWFIVGDWPRQRGSVNPGPYLSSGSYECRCLVVNVRGGHTPLGTAYIWWSNVAGYRRLKHL